MPLVAAIATCRASRLALAGNASKCDELSRGGRDHIYAKKDVAKMLRLLGRGEEALAVIEPVARELKGKGQSDGYIAAEYGECLLVLGRVEEGERELEEAKRLLAGGEQ